MNGILDKLQNVLVPFSQKVNENKVLKGISKGFASMLPIVMVGAIFTLLASLNISVYQNFITSTGLKGVLSIRPRPREEPQARRYPCRVPRPCGSGL